mmetsp:Transcript_44928/g.43503  ORF Transcript_44928/g.43503 Transcript_44928/m.43503 type:complete len:91 (+) Transcript_44928:97-369(+)
MVILALVGINAVVYVSAMETKPTEFLALASNASTEAERAAAYKNETFWESYDYSKELESKDQRQDYYQAIADYFDQNAGAKLSNYSDDSS